LLEKKGKILHYPYSSEKNHGKVCARTYALFSQRNLSSAYLLSWGRWIKTVTLHPKASFPLLGYRRKLLKIQIFTIGKVPRGTPKVLMPEMFNIFLLNICH